MPVRPRIEDTDSVNAWDLWENLESKQEFANWIRGRFDGFVEGLYFTVDKFINGKATQIDYYLTLDAAKNIAMMERTEKGREVRVYLIDNGKWLPSGPSEAVLQKHALCPILSLW